MALVVINLGGTDDTANQEGDELAQAYVQIEELPDDQIDHGFVRTVKAKTMNLMKALN